MVPELLCPVYVYEFYTYTCVGISGNSSVTEGDGHGTGSPWQWAWPHAAGVQGVYGHRSHKKSGSGQPGLVVDNSVYSRVVENE